MNKEIQPLRFTGSLHAMTSKSYLQRVLAIASLAHGSSHLSGLRWCNDSIAAREMIEQLGAKVSGDESIEIVPGEFSDQNALKLNAGESGLSLRLFSFLAALRNIKIEISGTGSLLERPIQPIVEALAVVGCKVESNANCLPIGILGPMKGGRILVDGSFSSQIISGLLMTLPLVKEDTILEISNPISIPYLNMTLDVIRDFGGEIVHDNHQLFRIQGNQVYKGRTYQIEGDWSAAANFLVGAAISGEVHLSGLNPYSLQADRAIMDALSLYGAGVEITNNEIKVWKKEARSFQFDATHCPDLFPPLVVLAASCDGTSVIKGIERLLNKESNRLKTLLTTFGALGLKMSVEENLLIVNGNSTLQGTEIESFNDHRIAMAGAIAAALSRQPIHIRNTEAVNKSYPDFFSDLSKITIPFA